MWKVYTPNKFLNEAIQRAAFEQGWEWESDYNQIVMNRDSDFLIFESERKQIYSVELAQSTETVSVERIFEILDPKKIKFLSIEGVDFEIHYKKEAVYTGGLSESFDKIKEIGKDVNSARILIDTALAGNDTWLEVEVLGVRAGCTYLSKDGFNVLLKEIGADVEQKQEVPF